MEYQKTAQVTGDKMAKKLQQNNSETIKKCLKKDIYLQKKDRKLLLT